MPEYRTPGVYVEEMGNRPPSIEGVATSTTGFLGEAERGPTKPTLVTSWVDYQKHFGGIFHKEKYLPHAVQGFFLNGGRRCFIARITDHQGAQVAHRGVGTMRIHAIGPGVWGNRVAVQIIKGTREGFRLRVAYWNTLPEVFFDPFDQANALKTPPVSLTEDFDDLVLDPSSPNYIDTRVNNGLSTLVVVEIIGDRTDPPGEQALQLLENGADGAPVVVADFEGSIERGKYTGLAALNEPEYQDIAIIYAPNAYEVEHLADRIMTHCERNQYQFAILDSAVNQTDISQVDPRSTRASSYAAFYFPWITIVDEESGNPILVPSGGHVSGIYARTDVDRGVWKAPAGEPLRGVVDLQFPITDADQDLLNPRGVNCLRSFPGKGNVVWGARTLSRDNEWRYVSVRRLMIFLEASIERGLWWVVFQPHSEELWLRLRLIISHFLSTLWLGGAFSGEKEEQAFFVHVDRSTMTQDDIDHGRLIVEIGVAPVRPAEFVIFRIQQSTARADT